MTGASFAGCAIALVRQADMSAFTASVQSAYLAATGLNLRSMKPGLSMGFTKRPAKHRMENVRGKLTYRRDGVIVTLNSTLMGKSKTTT